MRENCAFRQRLRRDGRASHSTHSSYRQKVRITLYENATPVDTRLLGADDLAAMNESKEYGRSASFPCWSMIDGR